MLDKSLMKTGFIFRYTVLGHRESHSGNDVILMVKTINLKTDCQYDQIDSKGNNIGNYGHNEFDTFDRFNKINTIRDDLI
jgi:hypothetical protein